ncbi:hypothetical protein [Streptomyces hokutonensis]|uniref:MmyB-like transcription regulator ligand binding domain-containing protein n=1 Tax=Streptomyces hokutonensis TaxID=1306990 RepID=A0ABW6M881_9ACTN
MRRWTDYDVQPHPRGEKTFHHPEVGDLALGYQSCEAHRGEAGLTDSYRNFVPHSGRSVSAT